MTSSTVEGLNVVIYLITVDPVEGEMLAKAMNAEGKEIGRAKQMLALGKDESKLVTFTFGAELNLDQVVRYVIAASCNTTGLQVIDQDLSTKGRRISFLAFWCRGCSK